MSFLLSLSLSRSLFHSYRKRRRRINVDRSIYYFAINDSRPSPRHQAFTSFFRYFDCISRMCAMKTIRLILRKGIGFRLAQNSTEKRNARCLIYKFKFKFINNLLDGYSFSILFFRHQKFEWVSLYLSIDRTLGDSMCQLATNFAVNAQSCIRIRKRYNLVSFSFFLFFFFPLFSLSL